MKRNWILLGGAIAGIACATLTWGIPEAAAVPLGRPALQETEIEPPLNRRCVVTVDPLALPKPVVAGDANIVTGFTAPNVAEGILLRMDGKWVVLRDGYSEKWIAADKVIMIHYNH